MRTLTLSLKPASIHRELEYGVWYHEGKKLANFFHGDRQRGIMLPTKRGPFYCLFRTARAFLLVPVNDRLFTRILWRQTDFSPKLAASRFFPRVGVGGVCYRQDFPQSLKHNGRAQAAYYRGYQCY